MALSLRQARLCLDCDCLTDDLSCPWCDRDGTVPISSWFRPLDDAPSNAPRHEKAVTPPVRRWVLIVQPQQRDLYRVLREALVAAAVEVLYERRVGPRRRTVAAPGAGERRRTDRLRPRPTAVVYQAPVSSKARETTAHPSTGRAAGARAARPGRRRPAPV
jgi:hypothetical protein